jgi:hypothetical protein
MCHFSSRLTQILVLWNALEHWQAVIGKDLCSWQKLPPRTNSSRPIYIQENDIWDHFYMPCDIFMNTMWKSRHEICPGSALSVKTRNHVSAYFWPPYVCTKKSSKNCKKKYEVVKHNLKFLLYKFQKIINCKYF